MKVLELFSGTHSIGKVGKKYNYDITSLDRDLGESNGDYTSNNHIKEDIMTWDYKQYPIGHFDLITASPVCLWWSILRSSWIGRQCKSIRPIPKIITKEDLLEDIELYGKPMVDKVIEIIDYFNPKFWWIENPQTGKMKNYIEEKYPNYNTFYDVYYCQYSDYGYKKKTRFWTNIKGFKPKICDSKCKNLIEGTKRHKTQLGHTNHKTSKLDRYRIPEKLIEELFDCLE